MDPALRWRRSAVGYPRRVAGRQQEGVVVPTGRHGLPADVVAEHQRERLLAATIEQVSRRGYRGTSVDHIVKSARVGYVAFYELFEGKEDCFTAAFERIVSDTREELAERVSAERPWAEQISVGLETLAGLVAAEPERARVALVEVQAAGRDAYRRYEAALDTAIPKLAEGRELGGRGPELSGTTEEALVGAIAWSFQQLVLRGEAGRAETLVAEAIGIALSPYLGEAEARRSAAKFTQP
jgi:AcrR family transcriptional regulator